VGQVGEDECGGDGDSHCGCALDPEKPAPGTVSEISVHVTKDSRCNEGGEGVGDEVAAEEDGVSLGELPTGVPFGEDLLGMLSVFGSLLGCYVLSKKGKTYHQSSRKESSLHEAKEEASSHHACKVVGNTGESRHHSPEKHDD
jgi:hypothetical protein